MYYTTRANKIRHVGLKHLRPVAQARNSSNAQEMDCAIFEIGFARTRGRTGWRYHG